MPDDPCVPALLIVFVCVLIALQHRLSALLRRLEASASSAEAAIATDDARLAPKQAWHASGAHDRGNLHVYFELYDGKFALRAVVATLPCGVAELITLPREIDLMPTWNIFAAWGGVLRLMSPTELVAGGVVALPWPVPRHSILLHARLLDRVQSTGCFVVEARTPPSFEGELPPQLKACPHELPLSDAVAYLKPLPPSQEGAPRTAVEFVCVVDLARMTYMGGALAAHVPQWLLAMVLKLVVPFVYREALRVLREQVAAPHTPLGARLREDVTGVYSQIRRATGQRAA